MNYFLIMQFLNIFFGFTKIIDLEETTPWSIFFYQLLNIAFMLVGDDGAYLDDLIDNILDEVLHFGSWSRNLETMRSD